MLTDENCGAIARIYLDIPRRAISDCITLKRIVLKSLLKAIKSKRKKKKRACESDLKEAFYERSIHTLACP